MDVKRLLKVYNYVNDEKKPKVNLKFIGGMAAFLLTGLALAGFFLAQQSSDSGSGNGTGVSEARTEYVGLDPSQVAQVLANPGLPQELLADYRADHPDRVIEKLEEVRSGGILIGYQVTYRLTSEE